MIVTRRSFLAGIGAASAGLALGLDRYARAAGGTQYFAPNPFIQIGTDGSIVVVCHRAEMGQGIRSSLPVLIADELGVDPAHVTVVQGDGDEKYGDQDTDGSASVRGPWTTLRTLAATARAMLTTAAARRWKVPEASLVARDGAIHDKDRSLTFAELAVDAAKLPVPKHAEPRPVKDYPHVGKPLPLRDAPDIVTGRAVYGADVRLPGMLAAVVAHPPVVFGTVDKLDAKRALAVPGVVQVIELPAPKPPINFQMLGGVAVVADNTWAAMRGRAALDVTWHGGDHGTHDSTAFTEQLLASVRAPQKPQVVRKVGDADAALAKAAKKLEAEYVVPYLTHVAMEPPAAIARVDGTKCEVWACTQNPQGMQDEIAAALKFKKHDVTVHVTLLGGGFGRKSFPDFGVEAAVLAQKTGKPVRVQWTRDDDVRNGTYHAISAHALAAGLDDHGKLVAWRHRLAFPSIRSTLEPGADLPADWEMAMGLSDLPLAIPNVKIEAAHTPAHVRIGWLRSVCNIQHAFATCSFIDELAHETKRDPRDMMLEVYGAPRVLTAATQGVKKLASNYGTPVAQIPFDTARLHGVIARVSQMVKWDSRGNRALGIAAHSSFGTWVAVACEVSKGPRGELRVDEAWIAADCGQVLNPDRVRYQMEGGFVFAMSNALHGKLDVKDGAIAQRNFHDYRVLRMPEAPKAIHVELIDSALHPGGAGEPGVPPVAPAIANAWFTLTGVRMRSFPFMR